MHQRDCIIKQEQGFKFGLTKLTEFSGPSMMDFSVLKLKAGEAYELAAGLETAVLLMTGNVEFHYEHHQVQARRYCYFSEPPIALHCASDKAIKITASSNTELMLIQTPNQHKFESCYFTQDNLLENDKRGKDLLNDSSYRLVRTIFDKRNRPESMLVLGEIITFPGHWSSTPSHTHPHPEIYHYRFSEPQGFAFAENGDEVMRVKHNDTMLILNNEAHAHATAPGYCLYTLWFIRHLQDNPYIIPNFQHQHAWAKEQNANQRVWQNYCEL